ncbi:TIGR03084 family metal-binding protein [Myxococcota bacterium]|nr:TIGR03084 family metal-binding protein [Myxococcota bacterium]
MDERDALNACVSDLRAEGDDLWSLLQTLEGADWQRETAFKAWTVYDVVEHLRASDFAGVTTLRGAEHFRSLVRSAEQPQAAPEPRATGSELLRIWRLQFQELCQGLANANPEQRLAWVGPGMRPRMFASARQMETWAHGWAIYDLLGARRVHTDRIRNIATLGVKTFAWAFRNRGLDVPTEPPFVRLVSPSGDVWQWNDPEAPHRVEGDAVAFCQTVTQVRNIADTTLDIRGDIAERWMAIAQCFAGPPEDPPTPGSRGPRNRRSGS